MCVRVRTFVLHPVRVCVCDTSCERVWNVNNNKPTPTQPLHTPTILSNPVTKKKPQSSLRCYCLSSSFGATEIVVGVEKLPWASHRPWWQHWRIHPWLGKNVSWQPSHTHTHAGHISSKVKKIGAFCVPVLQETKKKKREYWIILSHIWRDEYFFFFYYFLLLFLFKQKRDFVSVSSQASADLNNDLGRKKPHKHTFILDYQMRSPY